MTAEVTGTFHPVFEGIFNVSSHMPMRQDPPASTRPCGADGPLTGGNCSAEGRLEWQFLNPILGQKAKKAFSAI